MENPPESLVLDPFELTRRLAEEVDSPCISQLFEISHFEDECEPERILDALRNKAASRAILSSEEADACDLYLWRYLEDLFPQARSAVDVPYDSRLVVLASCMLLAQMIDASDVGFEMYLASLFGASVELGRTTTELGLRFVMWLSSISQLQYKRSLLDFTMMLFHATLLPVLAKSMVPEFARIQEKFQYPWPDDDDNPDIHALWQRTWRMALSGFGSLEEEISGIESKFRLA